MHRLTQVLGFGARVLRVDTVSASEVLVLNSHRVPMSKLEAFLDLIRERYRLASRREVAQWRFSEGDCATVVLTFDDGFLGHLAVAEHLAASDIGAIFFIIPEFSQASNGPRYVATHIVRPSAKWTAKDVEEFQPLRATHLSQISEYGMQLGSHTMSHTLYPAMSEAELRYQICDSKKWLEDVTQSPIRNFAGPFSSDLLTPAALRCVLGNYERCFLTYAARGDLLPQVIARVNVEPAWTANAIDYRLRGHALEGYRYARRVSRVIGQVGTVAPWERGCEGSTSN